MRSRVRRASAPRKKKNAGRATPVAAAAAETKAHGKRVTGSRGPRLVRRDVPPAVVALSRALRDARVRSGLSAVDAAERVGVHFVTVYAWENVDRADHPSGERLTRVAEVYGTSPKALHRRADVIARELGAAGAGGDAPAKVVRRENTLRQTPADPRRTTVSKQNAATTATAAGGRAFGGATDSRSEGAGRAGVTLSGRAYAHALRVLAALAEELPLPTSAFGAAQRAITAPGFLDVFAAFGSGPLLEDDVVRAISATGAAVRAFVSAGRSSVAARGKRATSQSV
jgi:transcriptional regulator with XRE-family HTH domain